jgi:hypothetical protein
MVGIDGGKTASGAHPVPTMGGHPWWFALVGPFVFSVFLLGSLTDPSRDHSPFVAAVLVLWWGLALATASGPARVTLDGTTVVVHRRRSATRFDLADIEAVVETTWNTNGPLRVDGAERWVGRHRLPRIVPWPQLVTTSVHPSFWVRHAGVPESKVRGGGLRARQRGVR